MPFAVKLKQNEVMALSSAQSVHLVLTSITLDPSSKVHLHLFRRQIFL